MELEGRTFPPIRPNPLGTLGHGVGKKGRTNLQILTVTLHPRQQNNIKHLKKTCKSQWNASHMLHLKSVCLICFPPSKRSNHKTICQHDQNQQSTATSAQFLATSGYFFVLEERKERRKEARKQDRKEASKEGNKEGRKERSKEAWKQGSKEGSKEGKKEARKERSKEARKERRKEARKERSGPLKIVTTAMMSTWLIHTTFS